jgi:hypothetical protein
VNSPSVGELLQDASREVRSIMWEITALDGPALWAAWPAFAAQARDALAAVPLERSGNSAADRSHCRTPASSESVGAAC